MTESLYTFSFKDQFENTNNKIIPLSIFGGVTNNAVELVYVGEYQQLAFINTGTCSDYIYISYIYDGNNTILGNLGRTPVPKDGSTKYFIKLDYIYFTPSGELDPEYSPTKNNDTLQVIDASITIDAMTYSFDMMNKNINGTSNKILISGNATIAP